MMTKETRSELETIDCTASELVEIGAMVGCVQEATRLLRLLANERRLLILCFLATSGEMSVGALVETLGLSQSALSQHLAKLRRDGLVQYRREFQDFYIIGWPTHALCACLVCSRTSLARDLKHRGFRP